MSELVTGEAVVLGLRSAKLPSRMLAIGLDLVAQFLLLFALLLGLMAGVSDVDEAAAAAMTLGSTIFCLVILPVLVETLSRGRSLGKLALGLRVVRTDGGPVRFRHSLVRGLVGFVELLMLMGVPALICSIVSPEGRRLGDVFAGTLVVRERVPGAGKGLDALPPVSPELLHGIGAGLVALDLSAVPDPLWLAIRQFLSRLGQLDPAVAHGMAQELAGDLVAYTGQAAPYGVHPAQYLGAVLVERQRRDWERSMAAQPQYQQTPQYQQPSQFGQGRPPRPEGEVRQPLERAQRYQAPTPTGPQAAPPAAPPAGPPATAPTAPSETPPAAPGGGGFAPPA
ncbi:RDD family protein [Kitasatospora sp. NPDC096147]|uniref:RDD family protein n=1 Tax=Kitasatospora sp. NPDC096147 TaxID=3364093 RepID=UPI0038071EC3